MALTPDVIGLIKRTADGFPRGPKRRAYMADTVASLGLSQRAACLTFGWARDAPQGRPRARQRADVRR